MVRFDATAQMEITEKGAWVPYIDADHLGRALLKYGQHAMDCPAHPDDEFDMCNCGYEAALNAWKSA